MILHFVQSKELRMLLRRADSWVSNLAPTKPVPGQRIKMILVDSRPKLEKRTDGRHRERICAWLARGYSFQAWHRGGKRKRRDKHERFSVGISDLNEERQGTVTRAARWLGLRQRRSCPDLIFGKISSTRVILRLQARFGWSGMSGSFVIGISGVAKEALPAASSSFVKQ